MEKNYLFPIKTNVSRAKVLLAKSLVENFKEFRFEKIIYLLQNSADPNVIIPDQGVSPFHLIIGNPSEKFALEITKLFLRFRGDPNIKSDFGFTPLHIAAAWGRTEILHTLLLSGGDPWLQDGDLKTAFNYAFEERKWQTVEMLHHFQLMHSSIKSKIETGTETNPNFSLERIWVANRDNVVIEYVPAEKLNTPLTKYESTSCDALQSSQNTQKSNYFCHFGQEPRTPTPVKELSKLFEQDSPPHLPKLTESDPEVALDDEEDKTEPWTKDFCQKTCQVLVHREEKTEDYKFEEQVHNLEHDPSEPILKSKQNFGVVENFKKSKSFVSPPKQVNDTGIRNQLFLELKQVFEARSKSKINKSSQEETKVGYEGDISKSMDENVNFSGNKLKHMSDFATEVMNDTRLTDTGFSVEDIGDKEQVINKTEFVSCESLDIKANDVPMLFVPDMISDDESSVSKSLLNQTLISVCEEYKVTDTEEGVAFMERRHVVTPNYSLLTDDLTSIRDSLLSLDSIQSTCSSVPTSVNYDTDSLRTQLIQRGCNPGPILKNTKRLYVKKLYRLKNSTKTNVIATSRRLFSQEVENTLKNIENYEDIENSSCLEEEMTNLFNNRDLNRRWREGTYKTSFNYLLLDPRVTLNLPKRHAMMNSLDTWECFLSAIFYVGKGKKSRPYSHLYEALPNNTDGKLPAQISPKVQCILDIWKSNLGVVCLHVYHNIIPVEAYTREAAMIDALGRQNLKNMKNGDYYGVPSTWPGKTKRKLGVYLLYRALQIFINEGERQIKPTDIN